MSSRLTPKQELFCREYIACNFNASEAARRAGYAPRSAFRSGQENMQRPAIKARIEELMADRLQRVDADADYLLRRLLDEAEADLADILDDNGNVRPVREWPKIWRQGLVAGLDVEKLFDGRGDNRSAIGEVVKVKLADRAKRLEMLGRHVSVQAFKDNSERKHTFDFSDMTDEQLAAIASSVAGAK